MGPVGHVYFAEPKTDAQRRALAQRLVTQGRVPGVLLRTEDGRVTWFHARGETRVPEEMPALLPHPPALRQEIAQDLVGFMNNTNVGDLTLLGWSPWNDPPWSFAAERGAHGGFGPYETQGFALLPVNTPLPGGAENFIRPTALRTAALFHIGRGPLSVRNAGKVRRTALRLMTYNVHGCSGMDGRVSPRRVARVIRGALPDIVALQEVDLGRRRSRAEDQAAIIAREVGMDVTFCPTVTRGEEHYGHALLSRWPIEVVKRGRLPHDPSSWWQEPRSAIWVRVEVEGRVINVVTTHLGLGVRERTLQMEELLGDEWIGTLSPEEPVLLCGDFNALPASRPYRLATKRLHDIQLRCKGHRPLATFSSLRPIMRLDHIFGSAHFEPLAITVVRNDFTRVASDHLPLMADLRVAPAVGDRSTTMRPESITHSQPALPAELR
jgi:endonuclease/exonuclease/phosphatase family metal-dependent hydrolase